MLRLNYCIFILVIFIFYSCKKDEPNYISHNLPIEMKPLRLEPCQDTGDVIHPICVIADFPESKFEDLYEGLNDIDSVIAILYSIDKHWTWMSQ